MKAHPVPAKVAQALTEALDGTARERALRSSELGVLAEKLIAATDEEPVAVTEEASASEPAL